MHKADTIQHSSSYHSVHRSLSLRLRLLPCQTASLRPQVTKTIFNFQYTAFYLHLKFPKPFSTHWLFDFLSVVSGSESFQRPTCDDGGNANQKNEAFLPPDRLRLLYQVLMVLPVTWFIHWFVWSMLNLCGFWHCTWYSLSNSVH